MTSLVVSLAAAVVLAAPAGGGAMARLTKMEQGQKLFTQGEFEAALKALDAAAVEGGDPATLERVHLLRAQCHAARQDFTKAEDAFALALDANPNAALDPARVDPTLVKLLDSVRARLTGTLSVGSTPAGAVITVDGQPAGVAPLSMAVGVGTRTVEARWGDGASSATQASVRPKREVRVEWVQGASAPAVERKAEAPMGRPLRPYAEVRGTLEIPSVAAPVRGGLDFGGGVELGFFRLGVLARVFPYFGASPRFALSLPVIERLSVYVEAHLPLWFRSAGVALGVGGGAGAEFHLLPWLGFFGQFGGQHLFLNPGANDATHFTGAVGTRLRLP